MSLNHYIFANTFSGCSVKGSEACNFPLTVTYNYCFRRGVVTKVVGICANLDRLLQFVISAGIDHHLSITGIGHPQFVQLVDKQHGLWFVQTLLDGVDDCGRKGIKDLYRVIAQRRKDHPSPLYISGKVVEASG